ncbi:MAG TPA: elongation factor P maturation arginine rhamnosyltransferase EarP [Thiobacillaceae bacterium]|nr:elongation factor P maturation arginine rhamnosyltransferase EarP [Thiobacillaceae bacterium]HNU64707.1 elongation factor P maturation arginine rhamnosyltransferase EarP [Thiobacillaceae bacterium]
MAWDIFCRVIDNYGDIGVSWRLARQLAVEHRLKVRLWVDDLTAFQSIRPQIDPFLDTQTLAGVEVRRWSDPLPRVDPGEVVIEALACDLPEAFVQRMAARRPRPVWLNLEYLTAESWAAGVHGLPSPHPRLGLTKYFFMPGYDTRTGGLIREADLLATRDAFQNDPGAQGRFWARLGLPAHPPGEWHISLFSYENAALDSLLTTLAQGKSAVRLLVPRGKVLPAIARWLGLSRLQPGDNLRRGALDLHVLPMLDQDSYDRLLWACGLNFVRGEDSFLRAQFAARPLVWQAYRQEEGAHLAKLEAFLAQYCADMDTDAAAATRQLWSAWNDESDVSEAWCNWSRRLEVQHAHAGHWAAQLATQTDLATRLLTFCEDVRTKC